MQAQMRTWLPVMAFAMVFAVESTPYLGADHTSALAMLRQALDPVRPIFAEQLFIGGHAPSFADYILFGVFQWARVMSPIRLLEPDDPLYAWRERLLELHGGIARRAMGFPV